MRYVTVLTTPAELNKLISRYVVEDMRPLSTVESKRAQENLGIEYVATTDVWTAINKSFMGVTVHWINASTVKKHYFASVLCQKCY